MATRKTPPEFVLLLKQVMAGYGKALPDPTIIEAWWEELSPFKGDVIRRAFAAYRLDKPDHAPVPNSIAARCRLLDGRPDENEAWALAVSSRDEADTVVWTAECARAFAVCQPVLAIGDEVGARMAFKEAYVRMVSEARAVGDPVEWTVSQGWDMARRAVALNRAVAAGQLPAPAAAALLPAPAEAPKHDEKARVQLAKVKQLLADSVAAKAAQREAAAEQQRQADEAWRRETSARVDQYLKDNS